MILSNCCWLLWPLSFSNGKQVRFGGIKVSNQIWWHGACRSCYQLLKNNANCHTNNHKHVFFSENLRDKVLQILPTSFKYCSYKNTAADRISGITGFSSAFFAFTNLASGMAERSRSLPNCLIKYSKTYWMKNKTLLENKNETFWIQYEKKIYIYIYIF